MVEFVVLLPVLLLILAIGMDFAQVMKASVALSSAVRTGVSAGVQALSGAETWTKPSEVDIVVNSSVFNAMTSAATADAGSYPITFTAVEAWCRCPDPSNGFTAPSDQPALCNNSDYHFDLCQDPEIHLRMVGRLQLQLVLQGWGYASDPVLTEEVFMSGY